MKTKRIFFGLMAIGLMIAASGCDEIADSNCKTCTQYKDGEEVNTAVVCGDDEIDDWKDEHSGGGYTVSCE